MQFQMIIAIVDDYLQAATLRVGVFHRQEVALGLPPFLRPPVNGRVPIKRKDDERDPIGPGNGTIELAKGGHAKRTVRLYFPKSRWTTIDGIQLYDAPPQRGSLIGNQAADRNSAWVRVAAGKHQKE